MSDNELDAELLAMAGDGSDDEGELDSALPSAAASPTPEPKQSVEQEEDPSASRKGVAQKVRAKRRPRRKQDSDEEDEVSPSPSRSLGSGAMHPSDSDIDAPLASDDDEERALYPLEGKFLSANDRAEILAMPEIKREEILAERAQEVTKRQQDLQLKKALAAAQAAGNKAKRKAAAADLEEGGRRTTRPRAEKVPTALDKYKAAREQKGAERGRASVTKTRRGDSRSQTPTSERDADGESDVEWAEPRVDSRRDREEPPPELRDFERCRVGRSNFAKVCFYPNFETSIKGCFARVSIGVNRETGQNQYRMAQIRGFTEGKAYQLEMANGKQITTDQYAIVAQGSLERHWPFSACSDGRFTPAELERYDKTLRDQSKSLPSRKFLVGKVEDINRLLSQDWTDKQINEKLARQTAMERKYDPVWQAKVKRDAIMQRKSQAEADNDFDEIEKCETELKELAEASMAAKASPSKPAVLTQQERLAQVNMRNRGKNAEDVRRALIGEKRKLHAARAAQLKVIEAAEAAAKEAEEKKKKLLAVPGDDLFGEGSDASRAGTPAAGTPKRSRAGTPANGTVKKEKGPLGALRKKNLDDDFHIDLGIDIQI